MWYVQKANVHPTKSFHIFLVLTRRKENVLYSKRKIKFYVHDYDTDKKVRKWKISTLLYKYIHKKEKFFHHQPVEKLSTLLSRIIFYVRIMCHCPRLLSLPLTSNSHTQMYNFIFMIIFLSFLLWYFCTRKQLAFAYILLKGIINYILTYLFSRRSLFMGVERQIKANSCYEIFFFFPHFSFVAKKRENFRTSILKILQTFTWKHLILFVERKEMIQMMNNIFQNR